MVSNALIQPRTEVFNTYGETLTNAQLLTQYGFILDANENDCITWDAYEVYQYIANRTTGYDYESRQLLSVWNDVLTRTGQDRMFESIDSQLVYIHPEGASGDLCLNGDGKISHQLWVLLALPFCLQGERDGDISVLNTLKDLLAYQVLLESGSGSEMLPGKDAAVTATIASHITDLAHSVTDLCVSRKVQLGKEGVSLTMHGDLGDVLDVSLHIID
jgi:N-lysine methyltransferase SETD6